MALYLLAIPAILLTMMITPNAGRVFQGSVAGPETRTQTRLPWWDDLSVSGPSLVLIAGIVLAAGTTAWTVPSRVHSLTFYGRPWGSFPLALADRGPGRRSISGRPCSISCSDLRGGAKPTSASSCS